MSPAEANVGSSNSLLLFKQAASWPQLGSSEQWGQRLRILVLCRDAGSVYIHGPSPPCLSRTSDRACMHLPHVSRSRKASTPQPLPGIVSSASSSHVPTCCQNSSSFASGFAALRVAADAFLSWLASSRALLEDAAWFQCVCSLKQGQGHTGHKPGCQASCQSEPVLESCACLVT